MIGPADAIAFRNIVLVSFREMIGPVDAIAFQKYCYGEFSGSDYRTISFKRKQVF